MTIDTKRLRSKILDLAIRGKLVAQDPNDEPASVLLERIREEKLRLVEEGKLKPKDIKNDSVIYRGDDNSHYEKIGNSEPVCIDEEIPFELPDGWEWARLGSAVPIARGGSPRPIKEYLTKNADGINWIKIGDCTKGARYITSVSEKIKPEGLKKSRMVHSGDFLLTNSMSFGRPYILKVDGCIHDGWLVLERPERIFDIDYLYHLLSSVYAYDQFSLAATGSTVKNLNIDKVKQALMPVPPMAEQNRIATALDEYLGLVDEIERNQQELEELFKKTRSKVLDLAIRGKLVEQDPNDEPAEVLLQRIHEEKLAMVERGELKAKDVKGDTVIFRGDDNSYYERNLETGKNEELDGFSIHALPPDWEWSNIESITSKLTIGDGDWILSENMVTKGPIKLIQLGNIKSCNYEEKSYKYISNQTYKDLSCTDVLPGYLLISRLMANGLDACLFPAEKEGHYITAVDVCWIAPAREKYDLQYLMYVIASPYFQSAAKIFERGSTRKRISKGNLIKIPVPIPPLAEQKVIAAELNTILTILDN